MISRRQILAMAGPATAWLASPSTSQGWQAPDRPRMGGAPTAFAMRSQAARRGGKPFDMVEHCHGLGLAGTGLGGLIMLWLAILKLTGHELIMVEHGPLMIAGGLLLLGGLMMFSTGLIGEMMMRTYFESQGRR